MADGGDTDVTPPASKDDGTAAVEAQAPKAPDYDAGYIQKANDSAMSDSGATSQAEGKALRDKLAASTSSHGSGGGFAGGLASGISAGAKMSKATGGSGGIAQLLADGGTVNRTKYRK
jgi:hypothetical protein